MRLIDILNIMDDGELIEIHDAYATMDDFTVFIGYVKDAKRSSVRDAEVIAISAEMGYISLLIEEEGRKHD